MPRDTCGARATADTEGWPRFARVVTSPGSCGLSLIGPTTARELRASLDTSEASRRAWLVTSPSGPEIRKSGSPPATGRNETPVPGPWEMATWRSNGAVAGIAAPSDDTTIAVGCWP